MYGRGHRLLTQPAQSTAPGVGPGTYQVDDRRRNGGSYAPFQSMAVRESFLTVGAQVAAAPGPAHYTPGVEREHMHVKGGNSLKSKAERFQAPKSEVPGPGMYSVSKKSDWLRKTYPPPNENEPPQMTLHPGLFRSGRLLFTRKPTAPSIPAPGQGCGYDETDEGRLTPQPPPSQDSTLGPAYYDVSHNDTTTTVKYKGVHFGNLRSLRTQFSGREGPGPGDYHSFTEEDEEIVHPPPQSTATPQSLPRYHELVTRQEEKKAVPGPGKYEIRSQFRSGQSGNGAGQNEDTEDEEEFDAHAKAPFGSRQQRFISPKYHSPSCTAYQDPRSALNMRGGGMGGGKAPFGQSSLRFRGNSQARQIPGPGTYNNSQMTSMVADLSKRAQFHGTFKCPFGSTSVRTAPLVKRDKVLLPGPAHYQRKAQSEAEYGTGERSAGKETSKKKVKGGVANSDKLSYTFASTTSRLYSPPSIVTDIPPPGSYELSESYTTSQDRDQSVGGQRAGKGGFLSSSLRFAPPRDILLEVPDTSNPGPGEYECSPTLGRGKPGLLCRKDERFKPASSKVPGPGAYTLSKTFKDTLLHGTYNVTLKNPLTDDHTSPEKTAKKQTLVIAV